jgi:hypothetical protein
VDKRGHNIRLRDQVRASQSKDNHDRIIQHRPAFKEADRLVSLWYCLASRGPVDEFGDEIRNRC